MTNVKNVFHLTKDGIQALKDELHELMTSRREDIALRLKDAKADGDLNENAMYDAARDEQSFVEGRIAEIEHILKHAVVIQSRNNGVVSLGATVLVELEEGQQTYRIVGSTEANPDEGKISDVSPIGKALLGKKQGEEVEVEVPNGVLIYKILKVD